MICRCGDARTEWRERIVFSTSDFTQLLSGRRHDEGYFIEKKLIKQGTLWRVEYIQLENHQSIVSKRNRNSCWQRIDLVDTKYELEKLADTIYLMMKFIQPDHPLFLRWWLPGPSGKGEKAESNCRKEVCARMVDRKCLPSLDGQTNASYADSFVTEVSAALHRLYEQHHRISLWKRCVGMFQTYWRKCIWTALGEIVY